MDKQAKTKSVPKKKAVRDKEGSISDSVQSQGRTLIAKWSRKFISGAIITTYLFAIVSTYQARILPAEFFYPLLLICLLTTAFAVYQLLQNRRRGTFKKVLLSITVLLVLIGNIYIAVFSRNTNEFLNNIQSASKVSTGTNIAKPFVVYISGIDTYGEVSTTSRSDVNILAVVNPQTKKILLVNTPRDYYVQLHGITGPKDKLTHAGIYGIDMSRDTMQDLYDIKIDYTVRINFTSLMNIVDALGGIEVQSDQAFSAGGYNFNVGSNMLNSKQALAFSRERHSFADGDRQRGKNQQRVIEAVIAKASKPNIILNYQSVLSALSNSFQTNASKQEISTIIRQQLDSAGKWQTQSISVDGTGASRATYSMGTQQSYVMIPDQATVDSAISIIKSATGR